MCNIYRPNNDIVLQQMNAFLFSLSSLVVLGVVDLQVLQLKNSGIAK